MTEKQNARRVVAAWGFDANGEPSYRLVAWHDPLAKIVGVNGFEPLLRIEVEARRTDAMGQSAWRRDEASLDCGVALRAMLYDLGDGRLELGPPVRLEPPPSDWTTYEGIEGFVPGLNCTVRECVDCGCLVPGGPTRCKRCAADLVPKREKT